MNKSFLCLLALLAIVFSCFALTACGGDDDDSSHPATDDDAGDDDTSIDDDSAPVDDDTTDDDADDDTPLPDWLEIEAGQMTVRIRTNPYYMEILGPEEQTLLATTEPEKGLSLSPMPFTPHAVQVGDIDGKWYAAQYVTGFTQEENNSLVAVQMVNPEDATDTATLRLLFQVETDDHLTYTAALQEDMGDSVRHTAAYKLDNDEHFFGMGLQYDSIDSRGKLRTMFLGLGMDLTDQIQNHAPMPFYISSRGYGLFVEDKGHGYFDFGFSKRKAYGYKFRTSALKTHIFYDNTPRNLIRAYTEVTGRPPMNPDYLFGHLHWRNNNNSEDEIYSDAEQLRAHGIPTSAILLDAPWQTSYSTFEFCECEEGCQLTDAEALIDAMHDQGYAFYVWTAEFVNKTSPVEVGGMIADNSAQFNYAKNHDYLLSILGLVYQIPWWHETGAMVNFLNPDAYDWYQDQARNAMDKGIQGFKMDGGEYPGAETLGLWTTDAIDYNGFGETNTAQYEYKFAYHQLFWELAQEYNGDLGIATVRCAVWGEQTHINYFWPGDMDSSWGTDLGLPADIVGGLTLGTAGFPYYGSNDGGFSGYGTDDPELLARWTEYSAFRPIFESPRNGTQQIWTDYPAGTEEMYRKYAVMHTRLFPYMKAYAQEATESGIPIMRMLPLMYLGDTNTYDRDFDYMLGDYLLVAPVYRQGATTREVYFPEGRWVNYWTNEVHDGPGFYTEDAPQDEIPVYAKAGAIVPLLDESVETLWVTDNPDVIDHEDVGDLMWLDLYPYEDSQLRLADNTSFMLYQNKGGTTLSVSNTLIVRTYSLRLVTATFGGNAPPSSVEGPSGMLDEYASYAAWNAAENGWYYDAAAGNLWVRDRFSYGNITMMFLN